MQPSQQDCMPDKDTYLGGIPGNTVGSPEGTAGTSECTTLIHVASCCPDYTTDWKGDKVPKKCDKTWGKTRDPNKYPFTFNVIR